MTFVHVFQTCNQDSCAVLSVMKDVIGKLKSLLPQLKSVFYRQDNAMGLWGYYNGSQLCKSLSWSFRETPGLLVPTGW